MTLDLWKSIPGHFTFPDYYAWLASRVAYPMVVRKAAHLVEVGVAGGQSAAFLAGRLLLERCRVQADAYVRLDLVDTFPNGYEAVRAALAPVAEVLGQFRQGLSWEVADCYPNESLDAVFLDADHAYESIARDIDAWLPKIRPGGILAGHDYSAEFRGILQAVTERFGRIDVWRGERFRGPHRDQPEGNYYPVWSVGV